MRIAVLEAVCAGLCGADPPPSLLAEGLAMWRALIEDLLAIPDVTIETVVDDRWFESLPPSPQVHAWRVTDIAEAMTCWQNCLEETDAAWIIAPESGGLLEQLVTAVPSSHVVFNATPEAIRLCADKLALAQHLARHDITTIPTVPETWTLPPEFDGDGLVIKSRDGAGSELVRRIDDLPRWQSVRNEYLAAGTRQAIRQPFVAGTALSIAGWFHAQGVQWFPVAEQILGRDFAYCGGIIPTTIDKPVHEAVQKLAASAAATIPGLHGYIGFDVLLPDQAPPSPVLVEINPRLTTSSLGYRQLCAEPWLARLLTEPERPLKWRTKAEIHFTASGVWREWTP